jgi:hypothetical protein
LQELIKLRDELQSAGNPLFARVNDIAKLFESSATSEELTKSESKYGDYRFLKREVEIVHPYFTSEDMSHLD